MKNMIHAHFKTEAAYRAATITSIQSLKYDAVRLGFDWPTDPDYDTATTQELSAFQSEVLKYIMDNWDNYSGDYSEVKI